MGDMSKKSQNLNTSQEHVKQSDVADLVEQLKRSAESSSKASEMMARAKSLRQEHSPPRDDLYSWPAPEQTMEYQAATTIQSLQARVAELEKALEHIAEEPDSELSAHRMFEGAQSVAREALVKSLGTGEPQQQR